MPARNTIMNKFSSANLVPPVNSILWLVLLITIIATFVPFSPGMPAPGLDPSWQFGMNQATAQGLSFGKEIIFTFGPYASIYTKSYHPSIDLMMVSGSLYLAILYWACFVFLMKNVQYRWVLAFCAVLAGLMYLRDPLLFSFPLLVGLLTFKSLSSNEGNLTKSRLAPFYVALLFTPLGLLPLVKGSILILCGAVTALCSAFFIANRHRLLAIICLFTPMVSMLFFWIASGQSVTTLPNYFISIASIVSGYTEAMAVDGNIYEVVLYLAASAFLLLTISIQTKITNSSKIFLFCIYSVFLFLSFKGGFVRHDGHAIMSGTSILIAALLLPFVFNTRIILPAIFFALISWNYIDSHYISTSTERIANNFKSTYSSAWHGIKNRLENKNWPRLDYDAAVTSLREQASFPVLQGTTDIYSYNQSYLIASGNTWSPRPIFQSYSVYTPALAEINRNHLQGSQAPDNIIFKVEPIDGRLPLLEDGASWPVLMANYQPTRIANDFLFLQKKGNSRASEEPLKLTSEKHRFGENVNLPQSSQAVFARIEIKPTILGRLASIFYKPSQLHITIELNNGLKKQYRLIAGMAKSGFVISPLIENTAEFGMLYGENGFLAGKLVKAIAIAPRDSGTLLWNDEYTVTFNQIRHPTPIDISKIYKFDGFDDELPGSKITMAEKCDGSIDAVNNMSPVPKQFSVSNLLEVNGWLAASVDKAALPEAVYVVMTDDNGNHKYLSTRVMARPDVGAAFKKPVLNASGYTTMVDISALEGKYTLGLAIKMSDELQICPQFKIPVTIKNLKYAKK
jgi:hypothetical protein